MTAAGGATSEAASATADAPEAAAPPAEVVERAQQALRVYWPLLAAAAAGLALRFWLVLGVRPACSDTNFTAGAGFPPAAPLEPPRCLRLTGDSLFNYMQGKMLAEGKGFGNGFAYLDSGKVMPSAGKPPIFSIYLAFLQKIGLHSVDQQRLGTSVLGALGIVLLGLLAWRLAGKRAGVIAAVMAAVSPLLWINDGRVMVEAIYVPLIAGVLLAAYHFWNNPRPRTAIILGITVGLASLARGEASQLLVLLVIPLVVSLPKLSRKGRGTLTALAFLSALVIVFPWVVRNLVTFQEPTLLQFGSGAVLLNGQCDAAYYTDTDNYGLENFKCFQGDAAPLILDLIKGTRDESAVDAELRKKALTYMSDNKSRVPMMVLYREGRVWEVYQPLDNIDKNYRFEDRGKPESILASVDYFLTLPFAIYGLVLLRRRKIPIAPFVAVILTVTFAVAATFGIIRFRVAVDAIALVLAAIAIDALLARFGRPAADDDQPHFREPRPWRSLRGASSA
jgi:4-amino-4-deoxy-L-arabinose transferase-like glycosyltransferase